MLFVISLLLASPVFAATCYYPDGGTASDHVPCNATITTASACCAQADSCSSSGLCLGGAGFVYMGGCTDSTFESAHCPQFCYTDPILETPYSAFVNIVNCGPPGLGNSSFCCSSSSKKECCNSSFTFPGTGRAFQPGIDAVLQSLSSAASISTTSSASKSSQTSSTTTTTSSAGQTSTTSSTSPTSTSSSNSGTSVGTAVGAGVGVPLGVLSVGLLVFLFWNQEKKYATDAGGAQKLEGANNEMVQPAWSSYNHPTPAPTYSGMAYDSYSPDRGIARNVELDGNGSIPIHEIGTENVR